MTRTQVVEGSTSVSRSLWASLRKAGEVATQATSRSAGWVGSVVTPAGWLALAWAVIGLTVGLIWGWTEFLIAGAVAAVLLAIAVPFLVGREAYDVGFGLEQDSVVAGESAGAHIRVRNSQRRVILPGQIDIPIGSSLAEVYVPTLRPGYEYAQRIDIPAQRRGIVDVGPATTVRADPLRLMRREFKWAKVQELFIHPKTVGLPSTAVGLVRDLEGAQSVKITNEDISFHAIREYSQGDAQRHIHWKSTAKTGTLMVRQFEETQRATVAVLLDVDPQMYASEDEFETAVSAVGSFASRVIRDGRDLAVVTSGELPEYSRATLRSMRRLRTNAVRPMLDDLSGIETLQRPMDLVQTARMLAESTNDISVVFFVTGSKATLKQLQTAGLAFPSSVGIAAVQCDDYGTPSVRALGSVRLITIALLDDLRQLLARGAAS